MNVDRIHVPNLIIADKICFSCINKWKIGEKSVLCGKDCGQGWTIKD